MREYRMLLVALFISCICSCHWMMDRPPVEAESVMMKDGQLKKWELEFSFEEWQADRSTMDEVFDLAALDILPLINDRCKGQIWKEECTKMEFRNYVDEQLVRLYPELYSTMEWHEMLELVIDASGKVTRVFTVIRQGQDCEVCDEIIKDIIIDMPRWNPGVKNGQAVKTRIILPFSTYDVS